METSMLNRLCRSLPAVIYFPLTLIISSVAVVGCGDDKLADDPYGFIDLAPYYYDGSSATNPSGGLVREIAPQGGWMNGIRAQYYDFGIVGTVKKRTDANTPDYAVVNPMYFFFNSAGQPLFSKPVYERRTGLWHMRGGVNVLDPNPPNSSAKNVPYSVRVRNTLVDKDRGVADYQRPIVDVLQHVTPGYSGLWEIYEVIAPDGYQPDAIKSLATLQKGINDGSFLVSRTQRVFNCPVIDDRQFVTPTPTWYGMPHPRIELWYRTKQGSCFVADGWLALGNFDGSLIKANSNSRRLNQFDTISYTIGAGVSARTTVVAKVTRIFQPKVTVANQDPTKTATDIRYVGDNVTDTFPKLSPADPPGYSPIRWLWDLKVPQDPPYEPGSYKSLDQMDPANLSIRSGPFTKNMPLIGTWSGCANNDDCANLPVVGGQPKLTCNQIPNPDLGLSDPPAATLAAVGNDVAKAQAFLNLNREGGPRCDLPVVRFGEFCAPGIARCALTSADLVGDEKTFVTVGGTQVKYAANGLVGGYTCQPVGTGYCYFRCDTDVTIPSAGSAKAIDVMVTYNGPDNRQKVDKGSLFLDARCGLIPGYRCLTPTGGTTPIPTRTRVCLRQCDLTKPDAYNDEFCGVNGKPLDAKIKTDVIINDKVGGDVQKGMSCSNRGISSVAGCQWDPAYEPRDPSMSFLPR
jgi:hypothetical protein